MVKASIELEMRPMTRDDLPAVVALSAAQGRNVHPDDYERLLDLEGSHAFVITSEGAVKGAINAMRYFDQGWLGPILLESGLEGTGLPVALAAHVVQGLQRAAVPVVEAEASEHDALILAGMGFQKVRETVILERAPSAASGESHGTSGMAPQHILDVGVLDGSAFGYGRKEYLQALMAEFPEGARVVEEEGEVKGFVVMRRSRRGYHIGPLVTSEGADVAMARRLLGDALEAAAGWPVVALAPADHPVLAVLEASGFVRVGSLFRMRAGEAVRQSDGGAEEMILGGRFTG